MKAASLKACAAIIGGMNELNAPQEEQAQSANDQPTKTPIRNQATAHFWQNPWLIVALLALALTAWQWVETRTRLAETGQDIAIRLAEQEVLVKENQRLARQSQESVAALQARVGEFEDKLAESKSQQAILESLYQNLAQSHDEWILVEIEQSVTQAAREIQLSGNIPGALIALQTAEARLIDSKRPQFIGLRKVLLQDLERLRALPHVDLTGMSMQLESVARAIDTLPLATQSALPASQDSSVETTDLTESATATNLVDPSNSTNPLSAGLSSTLSSLLPVGSLDFWRHLAKDFWKEMSSLVRIQRMDSTEPQLLAPDQIFFLRENIKLRLLNARLALLSNNQSIFRHEIKETDTAIQRYFEKRDKAVDTALATLKSLQASELNVEAPSLNDSLSAIKTFKLNKDKK